MSKFHMPSVTWFNMTCKCGGWIHSANLDQNRSDILNELFSFFPASVQWLHQCRCHRSLGPGWLRLDWWRSFWRSGSWGPCRASPPSDPWLNYTVWKGRSWTARLDVRPIWRFLRMSVTEDSIILQYLVLEPGYLRGQNITRMSLSFCLSP